jgi:hypothetical protein
VSNVLIEIIGVILIIGLALAGTPFLEDRFQRSQNRSRASAFVPRISTSIASADVSAGPSANQYREALTSNGWNVDTLAISSRNRLFVTDDARLRPTEAAQIQCLMNATDVPTAGLGHNRTEPNKTNYISLINR